MSSFLTTKAKNSGKKRKESLKFQDLSIGINPVHFLIWHFVKFYYKLLLTRYKRSIDANYFLLKPL